MFPQSLCPGEYVSFKAWLIYFQRTLPDVLMADLYQLLHSLTSRITTISALLRHISGLLGGELALERWL